MDKELVDLLKTPLDFTGVYTKGDPKEIQSITDLISSIVIHGIYNNEDEMGFILGINDWDTIVTDSIKDKLTRIFDLLKKEIKLQGESNV